jgi:hypothetical protein
VDPPLTLGDESLGVALGQPGGAGEGQRALPHEQHVAAVIEDPAGERHGIGDAGDGAHGAAAEPIPHHDRGVQLHGGVGGEDRAAAGVEAGMILQGPDRGLDRLERAAAGGQQPPAGQRRGLHPGPQLLAAFARVGPGAAVDDDGRHARPRPLQPSPHPHHRVTIRASCTMKNRWRA